MSQNFSACTPLMLEKLETLLYDADSIRLMELLYDLTDLGEQQGVLNHSDRKQLAMLNHLIAAVARRQRASPPIAITT